MKFFGWLKQNFNLILIVVFVIGLIGLVASGILAVINKTEQLPQQEEVLYLDSLTGEFKPQKTVVNPVAFIIDNATEVRPQTGLGQSSIVYEALAEGGITRFLAIYNYNDEVNNIGPVRSVRPYFLDWASEYQPALFHVGGSPGALEVINDYSIINIDEMGADEIYFFRSSRLKSPHNVYSSTDLWQTIDQLKNREVDFRPWSFKKVEEKYCPAEGQEIIIYYSYDNYQVRWLYDCVTGQYLRFNGSQEHQDEAGSQLLTNKVIVQFVKSWLIDIERLGMQTVGQGKALIFQNGRVNTGIWKKESKQSRTYFYNNEEQPIDLIPGKTWIEIVPPLTSVKY